MRYTDAQLVAERFALLNGMDRRDILNLLRTDRIESYEFEEEEE